MNTYQLKKHPSGCFESTMLCDGVTAWELHPSHRDELKILETLRDGKKFSHYPGSWTVSLPDDCRNFKNDKLDDAINLAIGYINERDNPQWIDHF